MPSFSRTSSPWHWAPLLAAVTFPSDALITLFMWEGQVHLLLGEEVHAFALGEYPPQVAVVVLHVGLLPGRVRVAVEDPRPDAIAVDASLDGPGVRELRPVVRQEDREDASEHLEAEQPLKPVEYVDGRLGRVGVPQEGQHGGACVELRCEQRLHFILLMGRTHCAHRYFLSHSQRLMHRFVTRPFAP